MSGSPIVVDGSAGGEAAFTEAVARGLRARGLEVEVRPPKGASMFDTAVHLVSSGIAIRVRERPDRATLDVIEQVVRAELQHRASLRRRTRTVPIHLGESARVLAWIDVFG
jgi:L-alanine-DL-glutamate epimerase-like enolase superfamily enzyme